MTMLSKAIDMLSTGGVLAEGACVWLFIARRRVGHLPCVFIFLAFSFFSDAALVLIALRMDVWPALVITTYCGYLVEAAAIWELICRLSNDPQRAGSTTRVRLIGLVCVVPLIVTYLLSNGRSYTAFGSAEREFLHVDLTVSIYRVLVFIAVLAITRVNRSAKKRLAFRVTMIFAVYAVCAMLKHIFGELSPRFRLPAGSFTIADCVCSLVWTVLLMSLVWHLLRAQVPGTDPAEL